MSAASAKPSSLTILALGPVDSTNAEARRRAEAGAEHGTLLWATSQTKGRGRRGREWVSPEGNLYASLVLRPTCPTTEAVQLAFVAALAVGSFLSDHLAETVALGYKWPNDVLVDGRKIAGVLAESVMGEGEGVRWVILGVGVNIASHPEGVEWPATSLRAAGVEIPEMAELAKAFGCALLYCYDEWQEEGFRPIRKAWLKRAVGLGGPIRVRLEKETFEGTFVDLDEDGALLVLREGEKRPSRVTAGDVFPVGVFGKD